MKEFLKKTFARFAKDEEGVTLVEYGIALTLAVAVGTLALANLGTAVTDQMDDATECLDGTNAACG
jgi:pilus assembly protein Flp/PilA